MTQALFQKDGDNFYPKGFSEDAKELSKILIKSFKDLKPHDRNAMVKNTFMVAYQVKKIYGNEIEEKMKNFTDTDWKCAWLLFNDHFYHQECEW